MSIPPSDRPHHKRLAIVDIARGGAVIAMALYHFSWDLSWYALVDWPVAQGHGWRIFAASIAGSFLFLAGVSLDLAHHKAIRWHPFWRREAILVAAAAAVSLGTYAVFGGSFVRFGILHAIAAASLIALAFVRLPFLLTAAASVLFLSAGSWASSSYFDGPLWAWTGLGDPGYPSVDYVPVVPWAGFTLAGLACSAGLRKFAFLEKLSALEFQGLPGRSLRWLGRHSLPVYLLHQPVLFGLVWLIAAVLHPGQDRMSLSFVKNCAQACQATSTTPETCPAACACTLKHMQQDGIWEKITVQPDNQSLRDQMNSHHALCLADPER